jgi:adenylosuccinate synthase
MIIDTLEERLDPVQVIATICLQYGDSGKGKISDIIAQLVAANLRGSGGSNAGHTAIVNGIKRIFHLIPAGITQDYRGAITMLGNGMVINLETLCDELDELDEGGLTYNNLMVSEDAHVVLPFHIALDQARHASQEKGGIGSTGRGIGPCYTNKVNRTGIKIRDLYDWDMLAKKLKTAMLLFGEDEIGRAAALVEMQDDVIIDTMINALAPYAERIKPFVRDTIHEVHQLYREGKKISVEGAQGTLLSHEFGAHPYVTSSDCSINGTMAGVGLPASVVDKTYGILKFPIMTRVGGGHFPTEIGGERAAAYCADADAHTIEKELDAADVPYATIEGDIEYDHMHPHILALMNDEDPLNQNIGLRLAAEEYGATTGRPRRIGWFDIPAAKYAIGINNPALVLTKADVVAGMKMFGMCHKYVTQDDTPTHFKPDARHLASVKPLLQPYAGFEDPISGAETYADLPCPLKGAIAEVEKLAPVEIISVGPDRNETIVR